MFKFNHGNNVNISDPFYELEKLIPAEEFQIDFSLRRKGGRAWYVVTVCSKGVFLHVECRHIDEVVPQVLYALGKR